MRESKQLYEAKWWEQKEKKLLCTLCPRYCTIGEGQNGFCFIRKNINNRLYSLGYGRPTGFAIDPIEKKPLNHFLPGSEVLSFGTAGCNLGCKFCQNWTMSKAKFDDGKSLFASPEEVVHLAKKNHVPSIAFTYNDPTIFGEYVIDISKIAREQKIKSVMVTAGYIDKKARKEVYQFIDAANVDLKAFSETFYHKLTFSHLKNILETLVWLKHETDVWLEITTLLIPGENDSLDETKQMIGWILENLGDEVPLHFTAFHPDFKMSHKLKTPVETLVAARQTALRSGIKYCYTGNIHHPEGQTTYCPVCKTKLIERNWHEVASNHLDKNKCPVCGTIIPGLFR
ncbi:MAG: AmmeMemoRadiSam system radical SAM enzyme [Ignavibacteria bacterium CG_4_8_14_3_um_filter_37_9]|nr:AmmeMemoRadiSam system radical SAM enzyme [Ignavibacteria bacterium]OIO15377.1 MAG: AmmeMemoRadiSam system radical SAM enzyme [Ignavibacteria bacterium CG1_02_37_35]PIP77760.1 MAG: AmmeMemoRadiSam system radical SAM enzyme [Ignavibacteria bacterium CG22_combo_CG10-13_8_21_14_all_37_15]PIS44263.1 MAG: AmmeMemoRadiSam system radical SAM enzyme [Ignavibacteria bacterium CG08_land_8_20_14_0_20_37_9]PIX00095.1 MAG: AmmeMemoRadiSam system radical SAM enzyme [Ignavibacteria bacterium CG_4_8_14_3_um